MVQLLHYILVARFNYWMIEICMVQLIVHKKKVAKLIYLIETKLTLVRGYLVQLFDKSESCTVQLFNKK